MNQKAFAAALLNPDATTPAGLTGPSGRPAGARFDVYRNNVTASLTAVLQAGFPVIERLVGPVYFRALAAAFVRCHPPTGRIMMLYGADFAEFLQRFPPLAHLPYLPDVARLEQALRQSFHAADMGPADPGHLAALSPQDFLAARPALAPSLVLIRSRWPVLSIWRANRVGTGLTAKGATVAAEDLVILRKGYDPAPHPLSPGMAAILARLIAGQPIGLAAGDTGDAGDLAGLLSLLLAQGAVGAFA